MTENTIPDPTVQAPLRKREAPGFRLMRIELRNWGTFNGKIWSFTPGGNTALLTGDVGSGKSTLVDAVTTLFISPHKISYNKAAGADSSERDLRSYVLGHYTRQRDEETDTSKPVALRDGRAYSVILGVFRNDALDATVTLATVFWMPDGKSGQPERLFAVADRAMCVAEDFSNFGDTIPALKKRLDASDARTYRSYPDYGRDLRRCLGIPSDQALELFHQTISMKEVGNLNSFVKRHMLEAFDNQQKVASLVEHFEHLSSAHAAVRRARDQLADLTPLIAECGKYDVLTADIEALNAERTALPYFLARHKADLLDKRINEMEGKAEATRFKLAHTRTRLTELRSQEKSLEIERDGHGGRKLAELARDLEAAEQLKGDRRDRYNRYSGLLAEAGMPSVDTMEEFLSRQSATQKVLADAETRRSELQVALSDVDFERRQHKAKLSEIGAELSGLRSRRSNIPEQRESIRQRLCADLNIAQDEIPFAGELIQVGPAAAAWEGAAERALRGFGLSLLVPPQHYPAVSAWVNNNDLRGHLRYYSVPALVRPTPARNSTAVILASKLEIKDGPFTPWLSNELGHRADHECADTIEEFRAARKAITKAGQIKGSGGFHEKDDRTSISDRRNYVLGWTNEAKIEALVAEQTALNRKLGMAEAELDNVIKQTNALTSRGTAIAGLAQFPSFNEIDWQDCVRRIASMTEEKATLEASTTDLQRLALALEEIASKIAADDLEATRFTGEEAKLTDAIKKDYAALQSADDMLNESSYGASEQHFPALRKRVLTIVGDNPDEIDKLQWSIQLTLTAEIDSRTRRQNTVGNAAVGRMRDFKIAHPTAADRDLDADLQSADGYRELRTRLQRDELPTFEATFKLRLNTNTIRDIAGLLVELKRHEDDVIERIARINESLATIEYDPGTYIELSADRTRDQEVLQFRTDLRSCTDDSVIGGDADDLYNEAKFLQVKAIIERFKGRESSTEIDKQWTAKVTDIRNWFSFSASSRFQHDNAEDEHYTDSSGKSGGQKEKLAYTILAASLAYQFKLDPEDGRAKTFRFVAIDEAFGRGSEKSARYGLKLFQRLGLQLMIVTPLQKIHVIEPFVSAVGYVDNPNKKDSRIQNMSIETYRERYAEQMAVKRASRDADGQSEAGDLAISGSDGNASQ